MIPGQIQQLLAGQGDPAALQHVLQQNLVAPQQAQDQPQDAQIEDPTQEPQNPAPSGGASIGAQLQSKGSGFLSRLFGNANKAADADPSAASKPGGWAKALVAGVSGAAQGVLHDFGDIAAAKDSGSGIQGIAAVQGARQQRIQAQADKQRKQSQEDVELNDKHQQNMALLAHTKVQQLYTERLIHNLDEESIDKSIAAGQKEIDQTTNGEFAAPIYEKDVDSGEYQRFLEDQKKKDPDNARVENFHAVPSGKIADPKQPTGYRTLYTIVGTPKTQKLTEDFVNSVNPGLPDAQKLKAGDNEIPGAYAQWLRQQSNNKRTMDDAVELTRKKSELDKLTTDQQLDQAKAKKAMGSDWTTALGTAGNDTGKALQVVQAMKNPDGTPKYPNAAQTVMDIYGGPKEWATIQKDEANEKVKAQEANANDVKAKADLIKADAAQKKAGKQEALDAQFEATADLTPKQYFGTLPIAKQSTYQAIQEGRQNPLRLQGRNGELTDAGQEFMRAFPHYDITKGKAFDKVRTDFEDKKVADTLTGYGTAMGHARMMFDNTGATSYIPGTQSHAKYDQDAKYLAVEVAKALNPNGQATDSQIKEQLDALTSINPNVRKVKLQNAMEILGSKYGSLQQRWQNALPDPENYNPPMPGISQEAQDSYAYVTSLGKNDPAKARQQQVEQNPNATPQQKQQAAPPTQQQLSAPKGAVNAKQSGTSANGTTVWPMNDGTIQDAQGNQYDPKTGQPLGKK